MRVAVATALLAAGIVHAQAQQVAFEVASIKRNTGGDSKTYVQVPPTGTVNVVNATLRMIIREAYQIDLGMDAYTLLGPPNHPIFRGAGATEQVGAPRFDIQAKIPDDRPGQQHAMLRTLLSERFKLRVHQEKRDLPVYGLTVAREGRLGPALRTTTVDCAAYFAERGKNPGLPPPQGTDGRPLCTSTYDFSKPGSQGLRSAGHMSSLARLLQAFVDRPIVDDTRLTGSFEWMVSFGIGPAAIDAGAPPIFTAVQEQLGLKLEPRTTPYEVLVIDSVEMPSEN